MNQLIGHNLGAKFLALLLALTVWAYVALGESKMRKFPSAIPIEPRSTTEGLIAKLSSNDVNIRIYAENADWSKLSADSFTAYVDLSGFQKGTYTDIPIHVISKISNISIREINPPTVTVTLDSTIHKTVPVVVKIEGQAATGMVPDIAKIDPDSVEVSGAKNDIDSIVEATALIRLNGETQSLKNKLINLKGFNAKGEEIIGLNFNPIQVKVDLPITKAGKSKTVGIKANIIGTPNSKYWISQISILPSSVDIIGNADLLLKTNFIPTEPIEVDGIEEDKTFTTTLTLPEGIQLSQNINEIQVSVILSLVETTKEVTAGINPTGLSSALQIETMPTEKVKAIISGQTDKLNSLNSDNVVINLDLSSFRTAGTYKVDISRADIDTPPDVSLVQFNPSSVSITLANK